MLRVIRHNMFQVHFTRDHISNLQKAFVVSNQYAHDGLHFYCSHSFAAFLLFACSSVRFSPAEHQELISH